MAVEIKQYVTTELARATSVAIGQYIVAHKDQPIVFFISGGSCLSLLGQLYKVLTSLNINKLNLTMLFGDERLEYDLSNQKALVNDYAADLANLESLGVSFTPFTRHETLAQSSTEYSNLVSKLISETKKTRGVVLNLLGMGSDGHIAGIFPLDDQRVFYPMYLDTDQIVIGHPLGVAPLYNRITLTFPGLLLSDQIIVYISGAEKIEVLKKALYDNPPLNENPALFFTQSKTTCQVFTDLKI